MDEDKIERIRASRGNYEAEVTFTGEAGLQQCLLFCDKNPGHHNFTRIKDFNNDHLPSRYRDNLLVDYVRAASDLTCRLSVSRISKDRPETWPDSDQPFPLFSYKKHNSTRTGTGWVFNVIKDTEEENINCQCDECLSPDTHTPKKAWGKILIQTASHVVWDSEEAGHTKCQFFYDSHETDINKVPTLTGGEVLASDVTRDRCVMTYFTHDVKLVDRLDKMYRRWVDLRDKVYNKYMSNKFPGLCVPDAGCDTNVDHDLCIIVSHPHGLTKVVTVGALTHRHVVNKVINGEDVTYSYNTPTCPGSSGAAVITLCKNAGWSSYLPPHSLSSPGNHNSSGVLREKQQQQRGELTFLSSDSDSDDEEYNMNHPNRGIVIIFNNKKFDKKKERTGTDEDAESMTKALKTLGFTKIRQYNDKTAKEMKQKLEKASQMDHSKSDCFVCVILSHGGAGGHVFGTDKKVPVKKLVSYFKGNKCKSLVGKPKLFFIQACRGPRCDHGVDEDDGDTDHTEIRIPSEADFLMAYSVVEGFKSKRNTKKGSWFIQAVVDVFKKNWKRMDLLSMMTVVNKKVARDFEASDGAKQMPCIQSMLTKKIYFRPKHKRTSAVKM